MQAVSRSDGQAKETDSSLELPGRNKATHLETQVMGRVCAQDVQGPGFEKERMKGEGSKWKEGMEGGRNPVDP